MLPLVLAAALLPLLPVAFSALPGLLPVLTLPALLGLLPVAPLHRLAVALAVLMIPCRARFRRFCLRGLPVPPRRAFPRPALLRTRVLALPVAPARFRASLRLPRAFFFVRVFILLRVFLKVIAGLRAVILLT